ncbi:EGF-like domain-containing protein [Heterostelium album PN500]|uniref:EGF-like domain-containing protein n=1 Tax=Heterostelium pallidum (strain ATCC 26659 / Pp 5 / PN500) TaxID=670386 RepID=D3BQH1_HETP5|nr:EGF-like domain-containing protein [Heterostelium album PN500]EFA76391.1 EGF-like domain-containing protein [Heterostelium album PN500]|eukprot:XP_020428523.1 EGF-like domain-containing protein [Heterostelium album PN500]
MIMYSFNITFNSPQYNALVSISNGASPENKWDQYSIQTCNLTGVVCKSDSQGDYVYSLILDQTYKGTFSGDIRGLSRLEILSLIGKNIGIGTVCPIVPDSVKKISFISTSFIGTISYSFTTKSLEDLVIVDTNFTSFSNVNFYNSLNLQTIFVTKNYQLTDYIPFLPVKILTKLRSINFQYNSLSSIYPTNLMDILYNNNGTPRCHLDITGNNDKSTPSQDVICQSYFFNFQSSVNNILCEYKYEITRPSNFTSSLSTFCINQRYQSNIDIMRLDTGEILKCYPKYDTITNQNIGTCCSTNFKQTLMGNTKFIVNPWGIIFNLTLDRPYVYNSSKINSVEGGNISISGYNLPQNASIVTIMVNNQNRKIVDYKYNEDGTGKLLAYIPPAQVTTPIGTIVINISDNNYAIAGIPSSFIIYNDIQLKCPGTPECSGNGKCVDGYCVCNGYTEADCSVEIVNNTSIDKGENSPDINFKLDFSDYNVSITMVEVQELTDAMEVVQNISLSTVWDTVYETNNSKVYSGHYYFTIFRALVESFNIATNYSFGTETLLMEPNTVKFTFIISDWPWMSQLNSLRVIYSTGFVQSNNSTSNNNCNSGSSPSSNSTSSLNNILNPGSLKSTTIRSPNSGVVMNARFAATAILDGRIINIENSIISANNSIATFGITIPYFQDQVTIDPDFSVILTNSIPGCVSTSDFNKRVIIIVTSVVFGVAFMVTVGIYIYHRHKQRMMKIRINNISDKIFNDYNNNHINK